MLKQKQERLEEAVFIVINDFGFFVRYYFSPNPCFDLTLLKCSCDPLFIVIFAPVPRFYLLSLCYLSFPIGLLASLTQLFNSYMCMLYVS